MKHRLTDRVAVVTGGARSIGAAIADRLAASGANVVVGDLSESTSYDSRLLDVSDPVSVQTCVDGVVADYGRLDIIVNNAGIMFEEMIDEHDLASWNQMVAINLTGPMLMTRYAARHLAANGVGSIVNIGSIEGDYANPGHAAYGATKSGVHGLTRATAVDLGPQGIRCNAIAPGWIDTPLNASYVDTHPDRDLVIGELTKLHPIGRVGAPTDIGDVAAWLASDESAFVTGQVITVDGGRMSRPSLPAMLL